MSRFRFHLALARDTLFVALCAALALTLAYQTRSRILLDFGNSYDAPFVTRFFDAENDGAQTYRWTRDRSRVEFDAQNLAAPWMLTMRLNGYRPRGAARMSIEMNGAPVGAFTVADGWAEYTLPGDVVADMWSGNNSLTLRADTFVPQREIEGSADTRRLGVTADWLELTPARSDHFLGTQDYWIDLRTPPLAPPWAPLTSWSAACALLYATMRGIGAPKRAANLLIAFGIGVIAASVAFARMWIGNYTASFLALALALAFLGAALRWLLPRLARSCALPLDARARMLLSAIALVSIGLKWGGAWYPQFRSSDLLFHAHRLEFVTQGNLFFTSELPDAARRVVPYPSALYIALAPLTVFFDDYSSLLILFAALADAVAIFAIYFAARVLGRATRFAMRAGRYALCAAFLFAFNPVSFWIYSWGNHTNIFAQNAATIFFALLLTQSLARPRNFLLALSFFFLASVGHLGVFLSLLAFGPLAFFLRLLAREENARREMLALGALFGIGLLLSWSLYYATFDAALVAQTQRYISDFGAGRAAGRGGISLARAADVARYTYEQLGWVLLLLGLGGAPLAWKRFDARARAAGGAWLGVGVLFALLTLGAAFSTRYTLWAAPALALSGALALQWLSERGSRWHYVSVGLGALAFAQALWLWLARVWSGYHA